MTDDGTDWRHAAACTAVDPELFFPTAVAGPALAEQEAAAKAVCRRCPVLEQCRGWAVESLASGVAGGLTEAERRAVRAGADVSEQFTAPINGTRRERAAAGQVALRCGWTPIEVATELGVTERTAQRWAAQMHQTADGSHGGNRAPVLISHSNAQAGTHMEGHRA